MPAEAAAGPAAVRDSFWDGRLSVWQPARGHGYRFTLDAVLLAAFAPPATQVLDLGAGCGIVGLLLLAAGKAQRVVAVERQAALAELCARNAAANGWGERLEVVCADLRQIDWGARAACDAVVFNPPYFAAAARRTCPEPGRDQARNERHGTLDDFARAARAAARPGAAVSAIVAQARDEELQGCLRAAGIAPCRRRPTQSRPDLAGGAHVLLGGRHGAALAPLCEESPLVVHGAAGRSFSAELQPWLSGAGL